MGRGISGKQVCNIYRYRRKRKIRVYDDLLHCMAHIGSLNLSGMNLNSPEALFDGHYIIEKYEDYAVEYMDIFKNEMLQIYPHFSEKIDLIAKLFLENHEKLRGIYKSLPTSVFHYTTDKRCILLDETIIL